jgi:hypothetical protein
VNPGAPVTVLLADDDAARDHLQAHVVVVGGGSVNPYAAYFAGEGDFEVDAPIPNLPVALDPEAWGERRFRVPADTPVGQLLVDHPDAEREHDDDGEHLAIHAEFRGIVRVPSVDLETARVDPPREVPSLYTDVALIARLPNPLDTTGTGTVTLVYGLFALGTLAASRAFTAPDVRGQNEGYLRDRFGGADAFWVLCKVFCDRRVQVTKPPLLEDDGVRIVEWPPP